MADSPSLPTGLATLWGSPPARRGPRPTSSVEQVAAAGIALADEDGLAAVSMARVAARLDLTTMALYRYVSGKDDLVAVMFDIAVGVPPAPSTDDWREALEEWARAQFWRLRAHPWTTEVAVVAAGMGPNQLRWLDAGLRALATSGLPEADRAGVMRVVATHVLGEARLAADLQRAPVYQQGFDGFVRDHAEGTGAVADVVASGAFDGSERGFEDADLDFGLQVVLDGVAALVARRAGA